MELENAIGVIDIGSNSFHMVVGGYHNRDYFKILDDIKVNVRLCEGVAETGNMNDYRMQLGEDTLTMFKNLCESYKLDEIITVATAAVRKAENGPEFVKRIKDKVGIDINVIPGSQEAQYDYLGAVNSIEFEDAVLMDIGGGSAQFGLVRNRKLVNSISLQFGSIDLMEMFDLGDEITDSKVKKLRKFLKKQLEAVSFLKEGEGLPVIGIGGTIRNIGRVHRYQIDYPMEIAHNYQMTRKEVEDVVEEAMSMNYAERRELAGLSKGRTDIFPGASYALMYLMEHIHSDRLIISNAGIRDGILYDYFGYGPGHLVPNIFDRSIINTMLLYDTNMEHSYHILGIARKLSEELKDYTNIKEDYKYKVKVNYRKILDASALLHDIGIFIDYMNHHEHSFYLVLNAGLEGMTQKGILLTAFIVLHHRTNKKIRISDLYKDLLSKEDKKIIDELSLYLQIGEYLDRTMDGVVRDLWVEMKDDEAILHVTTVGHPVMTDMVVEECGKKFKRVFNRNLKVEAIVAEPGSPEAEDKISQLNIF